MRHRVKGRKLGRTAAHREATLRLLATSLLQHKKIKTTVSKAKELRSYVEPLITRAKVDSVANRRHISRFIKDKDIVRELFSEIVEKIGDRPGGYTRVVKLGQRRGDAAEMAIIELVDYSDVAEEKPKKTKKKAEVKVEEAKVQDAEIIEETTEEAPEVVDDTAAEVETFEEESVPEAEPVEESEAKEEATPEAEATDEAADEKEEAPKVETAEAGTAEAGTAEAGTAEAGTAEETPAADGKASEDKKDEEDNSEEEKK